MISVRAACLATGAAIAVLGLAILAGAGGLPPSNSGALFVLLGGATALAGLAVREARPPVPQPRSAQVRQDSSFALAKAVGRIQPELPPPAIPGWRFGAVLGSGGMGTVHRAVRERDGQVAALKVLHLHLAGDEAAWKRLEREIATLERLDHPGIVRCLDHGRADGRPWLAMELVEGCDLRRLLGDGPLAAAEALRLLRDLAAILQVLHDAGLVHRDLKPENVLLDEAGRVRLADFGLAFDANAAAFTATGAILGSLHYMAPEQVRGGDAIDHRADGYALGVLAYELLTGQLPIGRFPPPSASAGVPVSADAAILRALERDPSARWPSATAFAAALG